MISTWFSSILTRSPSGGVEERLSEVVEQGARDVLAIGFGGRWRKLFRVKSRRRTRASRSAPALLAA
jgi:hypothetical protein